ncbi:MAG: LytR C-terminal domain-containing protein [Kineosporiaceae bacterium]
MSPVRSDLEEFAPIVDATRRGAHRARPSVLSEFLPVVSVVVVIAIVTAAVLILLGGNKPGDGVKTAANPTTSAAAPTPTETAASTPEATPTPEESSPEPSPSESASDEVDLSVKFTVLNDTDTAGLAKKAAGVLKDAGWTATPVTGNTSPKGRYDTSVVYYKTAEDQAAATQIAADLGIRDVSQSATKSKSSPVTVILGKDYKP